MEELSFEEAQRHLTERFLHKSAAAETDEELGRDLLDLILQSERLRRCVKPSSPEQDEVDRQTLDRLHHQTDLGPEHAFAESIFKRVAKNPGAAMRHYRQAVEQRKFKQSARARKTRSRRYDSLTRLIMDIIDAEPTITTADVLTELRSMDGIVIVDDEIRNTQDATTMKIGNLASRVSDAKKRASA